MNSARGDLIRTGDLNVVALVLHYIGLVLFVVMGIMIVPRIYYRNLKRLVIKQVLTVLTIGVLLFIGCSEYDNLSVFIIGGFKSANNLNEVLSFNQHLPWSVMMWAMTIGFLVWSIVKHNRFLRKLSFGLFVGVVVKVFVYDFEVLEPGGRGGVFLGLGLFLIGIAVLYPRLVKADKRLLEGKKKELEEKEDVVVVD